MRITSCSLSDAERFCEKNGRGSVVLVGVDGECRLKCGNVKRLSSVDGKSIKEVLKWVENKKNVLVSCDNSDIATALAYVVACSAMPVDHALKLINFNIYSPDEEVVRTGSGVLGNKKMLKRLVREKRKHKGGLDA